MTVLLALIERRHPRPSETQSLMEAFGFFGGLQEGKNSGGAACHRGSAKKFPAIPHPIFRTASTKQKQITIEKWRNGSESRSLKTCLHEGLR